MTGTFIILTFTLGEVRNVKLVSIDGPLYKAMSGFTNMVVLNFCWLICCIPIVTIGAATISAYEVTLKMVDGTEGYVAKQFFKAMKGNLKQGFLLELICAVCGYVLFMDFQLMRVLEDPSIFLPIIGILTTFFFTFSILYAFPQAAKFVNKTPMILRNSFRLSMKFFVRSFALVVLVAIEVCFFIWNLTTMVIGIIVGPVVIMMTISSVADGIFKKMMVDTNTDGAA